MSRERGHRAIRRVATTRDQSALAVIISGPSPQVRMPPVMTGSPRRWLVRPGAAAISVRVPHPAREGAPDPQGAGEVGAVDIGDLHAAVTVEIGRAQGRASGWRCRYWGVAASETQSVCAMAQPIDGEPRAEVAVALHDDDLGPAVAVEICEAGGEILEDLGLGQGDPVMQFGKVVELGGERAGLDRVAQDAMGVARGRVFVPRGDDAGGTIGPGQRALHRGPIQGGCVAGGGGALPRPATGRTPATRRGADPARRRNRGRGATGLRSAFRASARRARRARR
jgi:hypothetical protein